MISHQTVKKYLAKTRVDYLENSAELLKTSRHISINNEFIIVQKDPVLIGN